MFDKLSAVQMPQGLHAKKTGEFHEHQTFFHRPPGTNGVVSQAGPVHDESSYPARELLQEVKKVDYIQLRLPRSAVPPGGIEWNEIELLLQSFGERCIDARNRFGWIIRQRPNQNFGPRGDASA